MKYLFLQELPKNILETPILLSNGESTLSNWVEFLIVEFEENTYVFEIKYNFKCSPFKEVFIAQNIIGIGHEENFYLFDLKTKTLLLKLLFDTYFGHIYFNKECFYVSGANELYCINKKGELIWGNLNLGIDGVIIEKIYDALILGSGEWDPPNGWKDFTLNKLTGEIVNPT